MALYSERLVKIEELKKWVKTLSVDKIDMINVAGRTIEIGKVKDILAIQLDMFGKLVDLLNVGDDWRNIQGVISPLFYNAFFKVKDNAIKIANYYECLIMASDIETKKKLIKGFDYSEMGSVKLYDGRKKLDVLGKRVICFGLFYIIILFLKINLGR